MGNNIYLHRVLQILYSGIGGVEKMFYNSSFLEGKQVDMKFYKNESTYVLKLEIFPAGGLTLFLDESQLKQLTNKLNEACADHRIDNN